MVALSGCDIFSCRLVSGYNEKLAGTNTLYMKYVGSQILSRYHPHLPKKVLQSGIGVLFQVSNDIGLHAHTFIY